MYAKPDYNWIDISFARQTAETSIFNDVLLGNLNVGITSALTVASGGGKGEAAASEKEVSIYTPTGISYTSKNGKVYELVKQNGLFFVLDTESNNYNKIKLINKKWCYILNGKYYAFNYRSHQKVIDHLSAEDDMKRAMAESLKGPGRL